MADLDPRTALAYAKRMKDYCDSFNGRDWSTVMLHGSPDEQNLAHALDNLTECAAMLMNMTGRVAAGVQTGDNWQQYAKEGETARACIERHRREQDALLKLLAQAREPLTSEQIITLLPPGWTGMLAQVMEFARRIESAHGVATDQPT